MRGYTTQDRVVYWIFKDRIPVTKLLIAVNVLTFLVMALFHPPQIQDYLSFVTVRAAIVPWTAVTYPLVGIGGVISLLFAGYWLWWAGGSLERSWSSTAFALYFFLMSAATAAGIYVGGYLTHIPVVLEGLWLPIAGVTVAYALLNPEQQILFFFVIPLKLKYLALIDVIIVLVQYGSTNPLMGILALAGCGVSYWYVRSGRSLRFPVQRSRAEIIRVNPSHAVRRGWNPLKRYQDYKAQKRLRNLLDNSGFKDE